MNIEYFSLERKIVFNWFETLITKSIEELEGNPLADGKLDYYKQEIFKQYCTHLISIRTLAGGLKLIYKGRDDEIAALTSVAVLIRACLENYSMFHHIYVQPSDTQDTYFRFWSWVREGLIYRQRLSVQGHHNSNKLKEEKQEIDRIFDELQSSPFFQLLTPKQQRKYSKDGAWCFLSKRELLENSGFNRALSINYYNVLSSYTHPSFGSHLQTSQADFNASDTLMDTMLKALFICSGLYLRAYCLVFQGLVKLLTENDKDFVNSWCELGSELMKQNPYNRRLEPAGSAGGSSAGRYVQQTGEMKMNLAILVANGEGQTTEFKKSLALKREAMEALCSMVNADVAWGTVIFGIEPNGTVCGVDPGNLDKEIGRAHV
jgi:hypothetical protein